MLIMEEKIDIECKDIDENIITLSKKLCNYCGNILLEQLSETYKISLLKNTVDPLKKFKNMYQLFLVSYLNNIYLSLIKQNDKVIVQKFSDFKSFCNHSEICLLHIIKMICSEFVSVFDFNKLNYKNYETFVKTCCEQILSIEIVACQMLCETLTHKCKGIDISTCDPDEKLFFIEK